MFCNTYRVKADNGEFVDELVAIWVKHGDGDMLILVDEDLPEEGPVSVTVGSNWDFKDFDISLRTDVAQLQFDFNDPEQADDHEMLFYCVEYEQVESGLLASA